MLKSQDILLALRLASRPYEPQAIIATALGISASEVNHGLKRLAASHLYNPHDKRIVRQALLEFLSFGLRYAFPAKLGLRGEGMPTAHSAKPLVDHVTSSEWGGAVWESAPTDAPRVRGHVVDPIYKTAPLAAAKDPRLHELLALTDALRVGRAREREIAKRELEARLST